MELAKAYVQIVPSAKGIKSELTQAMGGDVASAGESAGASLGKNLVGMIGKVVAAAGIGKMIKDAITAGADFEQLTGGVETLFKDSADIVKGYAQEAYKTAGVSANEYMESATSSAAAMISSLNGDTQKAAELTNMALIDASDNANKMGSDLSSVQAAYAGFAKGQYTLLDNLKLGYGGTKTEMERLLADAEKFSGVHYDLSSYADITQAIHVIQTEMDITGTTAKEAATTVSGSLGMMKSAWQNMLTAMASGQDVSAAFSQLTDSIFAFASNIVPMIAQVMSSMPDVLAGAFTTLVRSMNMVARNSDAIVQTAVDLVTGIAESLVGGLPYLIEGFVHVLASLGESLMSYDWTGAVNGMIENMCGILDIASGEIFGNDDGIVSGISSGVINNIPKAVDAIGDMLVRMLDFLLSNMSKLTQSGTQLISHLVTGLLNKLPDVLTSITTILSRLLAVITQHLPTILQSGVELITKLANGLLNALPHVMTAIGDILKSLLQFLMQNMPVLLQSGVELVVNLAQGLVQALPDVISSISEIMMEMLSTLAANMPEMLASGFNLIIELVTGLIQAIPDVISAVLQINSDMVQNFMSFDWLGLGRDIINGVINGITSMGSALWDAITNIARGAFESVKSFFGIGSPSKLMRDEIGKFIPSGIAVGIEDNMRPLQSAMTDIAETATGSFSTDVFATNAAGAISGNGGTNYGGITINVTASDVMQSRDFVDWLENQLVMRQNNRKAAALA